jgi:hypothetical protein
VFLSYQRQDTLLLGAAVTSFDTVAFLYAPENDVSLSLTQPPESFQEKKYAARL